MGSLNFPIFILFSLNNKPKIEKLRKAKRMKMRSLVVVGIVFLLMVSIASASVLNYYGKVILTAKVSANPNIVLWLPFNEESGQTTGDISQYGNNGILGNSSAEDIQDPSWTSDCKFGNCLKFDGVDDYINVSDNTIFDFGSGEFTVEAWIKTESSLRQWVTTRYQYYGPGWGLGTQDTKVLGYIRTVESGTGKIEILGTTNIADNSWHHIALVRRGSDIEVYVDGSKENTGTLAGNVNNDEPVEIGRISWTGGSQYFNGTIDEPRIWKIALTSDQIRSIYEKGVGG